MAAQAAPAAEPAPAARRPMKVAESVHEDLSGESDLGVELLVRHAGVREAHGERLGARIAPA